MIQEIVYWLEGGAGWFTDSLLRLLTGIAVFVVLILGVIWLYLDRHPCLVFGPSYPHTIFVLVGHVMVPITSMTQDCLVRK